MSLVSSGLSLSIYYIGAILINNANMLNKLPLFGDMVVFSSYAMQVIMSFMMLIMIFIIYPRASISASISAIISSISAKRILEVLETEEKIKDGAFTEGKEKGTVEFRNVSFKYPDAEEYILENISFKVNKGETVAFIGSTGSGKSFCVACIVEQMAKLKHSNAILFDIHGEYSSVDFKMDGVKQYKIATPSDLTIADKLKNNILMVPYWLLNYEEMQALLLDRSDQNAPNQAMVFSREVLVEKENSVSGTTYDHLITVDSPVAYDLQTVLSRLKAKDEEMVPGARAGTEKQGPYNGKLTRFNQRLENKFSDKRMGFMFCLQAEEKTQNWLNDFANALMKADGGVKVIDMSEVPSDVLPLVIGLLARILFTIQQWSSMNHRHPIALLCDEAHLYVQQSISQDAVAEIGLKSFERIAKEGRKYGVGLVIISQRPSEVNRTVLSQCNNFISLRLTNVDDQNVIKRLLPDNLGNIADNLSLLDIAEAIIVGDATLLPSRVKINKPSIKPSSQTVPFWSIWGMENSNQDLSEAIGNMIKQSK